MNQKFLKRNSELGTRNHNNFITNLKRATALGISVATVIGMLTGCATFSRYPKLTDENGKVIDVDIDETAFPLKPDPRPIEEINEDKVTTQDVLDLFNYVAYECMEQYAYKYEDDLGENYDCISCKFLSFGSKFVYEYDESRIKQLPFYDKVDSGPIDIFEETPNKRYKNYYVISISYNKDLKLHTGKTVENGFCIPENYFRKLLDLYGYEEQTVTREYLNNLREEGYPSGYFPMFNSTIITNCPLNFTEQMIKNANQEQLNALYDIAYILVFTIKNLRWPEINEMPNYN